MCLNDAEASALFCVGKAETNEKKNVLMQRAHRLADFSSSLFSQLTALKRDPDLDDNPPSAFSSTRTQFYNIQREKQTLQHHNSNRAWKQVFLTCLFHHRTLQPPFSPPIAQRLLHPTQHAAFNMPIVEVTGPERGNLSFFCRWTSADITAASQHLEYPTLTLAYNNLTRTWGKFISAIVFLTGLKPNSLSYQDFLHWLEWCMHVCALWTCKD